MSLLEDRLNVALARLRVIEDTLHGEHLWAMRFTQETCSLIIPAQVIVSEDGVQFVAKVPAQAHYTGVELWRDDQAVLRFDVRHHLDYAHVYVWELKVESPLAVR
jgi:hypothetical protein